MRPSSSCSSSSAAPNRKLSMPSLQTKNSKRSRSVVDKDKFELVDKRKLDFIRQLWKESDANPKMKTGILARSDDTERLYSGRSEKGFRDSIAQALRPTVRSPQADPLDAPLRFDKFELEKKDKYTRQVEALSSLVESQQLSESVQKLPEPLKVRDLLERERQLQERSVILQKEIDLISKAKRALEKGSDTLSVHSECSQAVEDSSINFQNVFLHPILNHGRIAAIPKSPVEPIADPEVGGLIKSLGRFDFTLHGMGAPCYTTVTKPDGTSSVMLVDTPNAAALRRQLDGILEQRKREREANQAATKVQAATRGHQLRRSLTRSYHDEWERFWADQTNQQSELENTAVKQPESEQQQQQQQQEQQVDSKLFPDPTCGDELLPVLSNEDNGPDFYFKDQELVVAVEDADDDEVDEYEKKFELIKQDQPALNDYFLPAIVTVALETKKEEILPTVEVQVKQELADKESKEQVQDQRAEEKQHSDKAVPEKQSDPEEKQQSHHGQPHVADISLGVDMERLEGHPSWGDVAFGSGSRALVEPRSPKSPVAIGLAVEQLTSVGYICLADIEDSTPLIGEIIKLVRSDGLVDDVELVEAMRDNGKARCKDKAGRVLIKKDKYCFCIPLGLLQLARQARQNEQDQQGLADQAKLLGNQEIVENVMLKIGDWEVCFDDRGKKFYFNTRTEESFWQKPAALAHHDI